MASPTTSNSRGPALAFTSGQVVTTIAFVVLHIALAIVMRSFSAVATVHALATGVIGMGYAATTRNIRAIPAVAAYIVGCEVLWRMSKASVFWEYSKYASAAIFLIGLVRTRSSREYVPALGYFGALVPSIALTIFALDSDAARQQISFNLSGPLAITLAVLFHSTIRQTPHQMLATFLALIAPVVGICMLALLSTLRQDVLEFVNASTATTSGGYAANQVSAMLGLGLMLLLLISIDRRFPWRIRLPLLALGALLGAQATLTFARGGIALAFGGLAGAAFVLLRGNPRGRASVVVVAALSVFLGKCVIEPRLDRVTKGELSVRYLDSSSTGRNLFIESELAMFWENPLLGVGPGMGTELRRERGLFEGASHTEYSRMLAEHGLFGALALACLVWLAIRAVRHAKAREQRAYAVAMVLWVGLFLSVYGTRLAAPSLLFGLAFVRPAQVAPKPKHGS